MLNELRQFLFSRKQSIQEKILDIINNNNLETDEGIQTTSEDVQDYIVERFFNLPYAIISVNILPINKKIYDIYVSFEFHNLKDQRIYVLVHKYEYDTRNKKCVLKYTDDIEKELDLAYRKNLEEQFDATLNDCSNFENKSKWDQYIPDKKIEKYEDYKIVSSYNLGVKIKDQQPAIDYLLKYLDKNVINYATLIFESDLDRYVFSIEKINGNITLFHYPGLTHSNCLKKIQKDIEATPEVVYFILISYTNSYGKIDNQNIPWKKIQMFDYSVIEEKWNHLDAESVKKLSAKDYYERNQIKQQNFVVYAGDDNQDVILSD